MRIIKESEISHFGVMGMKWGVRRERTGYRSAHQKNIDSGKTSRSAHQKALDLSSKETQQNINDAKLHAARVKALKAAIKKKDLETWDRDLKKMGADEAELNKKLDAALAKQLKEFDEQSLNKVDRAVGRALIKMNAGIDRANIVAVIEADYIGRKVRKSQAKQKALGDLDTKIANKWADEYNKRVKGKSFLKALKEFRKMDKELSREAIEQYLELDLQFAGDT